jgi:four helix bundle protein
MATQSQDMAEQLENRLLDFSARVGKLVDALPETRLGRHIASQLVRSGTSPAPNYSEARSAESRADFVHKLQVALKELRESRSWIKLIMKAELQPANLVVVLLDECEQLINILSKSVVTSKSAPASRAKPAPKSASNPNSSH